MSYQNPPTSIDEDATAIPVVMTITPSTTTTRTTVRSLGMVVAIVAGMMMLMVAGGAVWMMQDAGSSYDPSSGSLFETEEGGITLFYAEVDDIYPLDDGFVPSPQCLPASGRFRGYSTTTQVGEGYPFDTCYQLGKEATYCWTRSYEYDCTIVRGEVRNYRQCLYKQCIPDGNLWQFVDAYYVNPVTHPNSCGTPCLVMHKQK